MAYGRDTALIRPDRKLVQDLLRGVDKPDLLQEIFTRANALALGRGSLLEFEAFCREQPCIIWRPDDPGQRHVEVRFANETCRIMVHVCRVVYRLCRVVSAQGPDLRGHEEVLHTCNAHPEENTAFGACLNPGHMLRGTAENRVQLKQARRTLRELGVERRMA